MAVGAEFLQFLSTPSVRRATLSGARRWRLYQISIHALRAEGDPGEFGGQLGGRISIHALRAEGDLVTALLGTGKGKISIHALRAEGDPRPTRSSWSAMISIHALRAEGDPAMVSRFSPSSYFYPRPPCGGRRDIHPHCSAIA